MIVRVSNVRNDGLDRVFTTTIIIYEAFTILRAEMFFITCPLTYINIFFNIIFISINVNSTLTIINIFMILHNRCVVRSETCSSLIS